ncbi:MAG: SDR family oxidoreductase [Burkholderiales bacterium]
MTGGSGLLALNWACALRGEHEVVLATHTRRVALAGTTSVALTLDDENALARSLDAIAPDLIVHTAGLTSVDACERDPALARYANAELARNVAQASKRVGSRLIHISTDHLFGGHRSFYRETDPAEPLNVYAQTKLLAEQWVGEACPDALIVRTNFFGWGHRLRQSFSDWIHYNLAAGKSLTMFDDVFITTILIDRLALYSHRLAALGASGIYNVAGDERLSKYAFGERFAETFGLSKSLLQRGKIAASQLSAKRPPDMSLDNAKARERLGTLLGTTAEFLQSLKEQDVAGRREELLAAVTE